MNAAANTQDYDAPFVVKGAPGLCAKPRVRLVGEAFHVTLPCGSTGVIRPCGSEKGWVVDGVYDNGALAVFAGADNAMRELVARESRLQLAPISDTPESWRALATEVDHADVIDVCKTLRKLLRDRTGRDWSVKHGRGTSYSWISIKAPPRRRVSRFGYMSIEDQILLSAIFGTAGCQGVDIRPDSGVRGSYVFRIVGCGIPSDWRIAERSWD